jgi:hypothetical protein
MNTQRFPPLIAALVLASVSAAPCASRAGDAGACPSPMHGHARPWSARSRARPTEGVADQAPHREGTGRGHEARCRGAHPGGRGFAGQASRAGAGPSRSLAIGSRTRRRRGCAGRRGPRSDAATDPRRVPGGAVGGHATRRAHRVGCARGPRETRARADHGTDGARGDPLAHCLTGGVGAVRRHRRPDARCGVGGAGPGRDVAPSVPRSPSRSRSQRHEGTTVT